LQRLPPQPLAQLGLKTTVREKAKTANRFGGAAERGRAKQKPFTFNTTTTTTTTMAFYTIASYL